MLKILWYSHGCQLAITFLCELLLFYELFFVKVCSTIGVGGLFLCGFFVWCFFF